jgi:tartrate dehydrogenase/decarboxylase/D-malate dehydrogenase
MSVLRVALYPGDGIGPEVIDQAVRVLEHVQAAVGGFSLEFTRFDWGSEHYREHGVAVPEDFLEVLTSFDAILHGAVGDPVNVPDHETLAPLLCIRQGFDQYACVRPCRLFPGVHGTLAKGGDIDLVVVRENSEGEYAPCGGRLRRDTPEEVAIQSAVHTRRGVERILRFGFRLAQRRRKRLTMITKSNALAFGMVLWDEVLSSMAAEYADVEVDKQHADAAAMNLVRQPERFDVIVASNLFGDILSDLAAVVTGGLGLAPSANLNPERSYPSLFEPVHGSAPDIAGRGVANPIGAILSAAMMLEWLELNDAARLIRGGVERALSAGALTVDLGGELGTVQATDRILEQMACVD